MPMATRFAFGSMTKVLESKLRPSVMVTVEVAVFEKTRFEPKSTTPPNAAVELAESAPAMFTLLAKVDEALEISPPLASTLKRTMPLTSPNCRKSPVWLSVDEA